MNMFMFIFAFSLASREVWASHQGSLTKMGSTVKLTLTAKYPHKQEYLLYKNLDGY